MRPTCLFIIILISTFLLSCDSDKPPKPESTDSLPEEPATPDPIEKRVILLIDVSSSITKASKELAASYARMVANALADESHLLVYTTEKGATLPAIVDVKKIVPLGPIERETFKSAWPAKVQKISETVRANCQKSISSSCILDGLKSVRTGLNGVSKAQETYLLVISDMLECCGLGCPKIAKDFDKMKKELEKRGDLNAFQLAALIPQNHIQICYISKDVKPADADMIESAEFRDFWKQAFTMLGYADTPARVTSIHSFLGLIE